MRGILSSRTKFERNLFFAIFLIASVLAVMSLLSLFLAQRGFEDLLQGLWRESGAEALKSDLKFFTLESLDNMAETGLGILQDSASECPMSPPDLYLGCIAQRLLQTKLGAEDIMPRRLVLYVKSEGEWQITSQEDLQASSQSGGEGEVPDIRLRQSDLDEFVRSGVQPKQRHLGFIQSVMYSRHENGSEEEASILVLISSTSSEFRERWLSAFENVDRSFSFAPLFSDLIWLQTKWLLAALVVVAVAALVMSRILSARLTKPLADLVGAMERVGSGDLSFRAHPTPQQEFGFLVESFNSMAGSIQRLNEETRQTARMKRELEMGRGIQLKLLPQSLMQPPGYELYGNNVASLELSGDYYDVLPWGESGELTLAIGDVSGKGIPAAMLMANTQAWLHSQAARPQVGLSECVSILNKLLYENTDPSSFLTFFIALLSPVKSRLVYVNAGHPRPLLLRDHKALELPEGGPLVGALPDVSYDSGEIHLREGDVICMYTDGVTEAIDKHEEEFGDWRLKDLLLRHTNLSAEAIGHSVIDAVKAHSGVETQADDITILILKTTGQG